MIPRTIIQVRLHAHDMWEIKFEGETKSHSVYGNKFTAVETARGLAKRHAPCQLVVMNEDGSVEYSYDYGTP